MSERQMNTRKPSRISERAQVKKDHETQYDPQIGAAAQANTAVAERAQAFSENFYKERISPLLDEMISSSRRTQDRMDDVYGLQMDEARKADTRYDTFGQPAERRYYDMVTRYSEPAEVERQATLALGDVRRAEITQQAGMNRRLAGMGINPTSPMAVSAMADMAVSNTATEAGAMNRARLAAKSLGMQLTSDAANYGRGGQSATLGFSQAAGASAQGGFGVASGALGAANGSAGVPLAGYGIAQKSYGANLDAYTQLGVADMNAQAQADAGLGQGIGSLLGAGMGLIQPFKLSDRLAKTDIVKVGELMPGVGVYEFRYRWGGSRQREVMADEVEAVIPEAVSTHFTGYKMVNYGMLPCV